MAAFLHQLKAQTWPILKQLEFFFVRKIYVVLERDECTLIHDFHKSVFFIKAGQAGGRIIHSGT